VIQSSSGTYFNLQASVKTFAGPFIFDVISPLLAHSDTKLIDIA